MKQGKLIIASARLSRVRLFAFCQAHLDFAQLSIEFINELKNYLIFLKVFFIKLSHFSISGNNFK